MTVQSQSVDSAESADHQPKVFATNTAGRMESTLAIVFACVHESCHVMSQPALSFVAPSPAWFQIHNSAPQGPKPFLAPVFDLNLILTYSTKNTPYSTKQWVLNPDSSEQLQLSVRH